MLLFHLVQFVYWRIFTEASFFVVYAKNKVILCWLAWLPYWLAWLACWLAWLAGSHIIHTRSLSVWELEYFRSVENIEISLYAQAPQSLLLLTQGNIYNRLRLLNKYVVFLEELNELFRENWSKFLTSGYLVFWKQFPAAWYLYRHFLCTKHCMSFNAVECFFIDLCWNVSCSKFLDLYVND